MKSLNSAVLTIILLSLCQLQAHATTPKIYLENRSDGERFSYLFGALETAMIMNDQLGHSKKSDCIKNWFAGNAEEANQELINAVHQVKDKDFPVAAIILMLIDRHCGDAGAANAQN